MATRQKLIEDFESHVGHRLPDDYRRFLLAGPVPVWEGEESPANSYTDLLHSFHDLGVDEDRDLYTWFDGRSSDLPDWFLVVAEQYGVQIGLGLHGPQRGRVFQWSWDDGEGVELAPSFDAFLAEIREREAEEDSH